MPATTSREEPLCVLIPLLQPRYIGLDESEHVGRHRYGTILVELGVDNPDGAFLQVYVRNVKSKRLTRPQTAGVDQAEED